MIEKCVEKCLKIKKTLHVKFLSFCSLPSRTVTVEETPITCINSSNRGFYFRFFRKTISHSSAHFSYGRFPFGWRIPMRVKKIFSNIYMPTELCERDSKIRIENNWNKKLVSKYCFHLKGSNTPYFLYYLFRHRLFQSKRLYSQKMQIFSLLFSLLRLLISLAIICSIFYDPREVVNE